MKAFEYSERQFVRLRPSLEAGFDFGRIGDRLSDNRVRVWWVLTPRREPIIDASDVILCGGEYEENLLTNLQPQIEEMIHQTFPRRNKYIGPIGIAIELWLDLRRDELDVDTGIFREILIDSLMISNKSRSTQKVQR